jgi:adenylate cyclase class 2
VDIEAEIKARLTNPQETRRRLESRASGVSELYRDTYFAIGGKPTTADGQELRLRTISGPAGDRHLLTWKEPTVDPATGSKPEFETEMAERAVVEHILTSLGLAPDISFVKQCVNFEFDHDGWHCLVTMVRIPGVDGDFLEIETKAAVDDLAAALDALRGAASALGIESSELTTEAYTDAVRLGRG